MNKILIFSTEPEQPDGRINEVRFSVVHGLSKGYINPLSVYREHGEFRFSKSQIYQPVEKRIGCITFQRIENYDIIKGLSNPKIIKAIILINNGTPVKLPNEILFDCYFPISDIPKKDLKKFRIIQVS